jgi:hypothetical protein
MKGRAPDLRAGEDPSRKTRSMADFFFALGVIGFTLVMLGLIWALDRV